jgi:hypothetical protein
MGPKHVWEITATRCFIAQKSAFLICLKSLLLNVFVSYGTVCLSCSFLVYIKPTDTDTDTDTPVILKATKVVSVYFLGRRVKGFRRWSREY